MTLIKKLSLNDILPLTCTRNGNCCHGKLVNLNPWELACLAREKKMLPGEFRDSYCLAGGIQLQFDGKPGWNGQQACSQYVNNYGCSVYFGRPLSCRLFPLGRQVQHDKASYMFQGMDFPCVQACPEVTALPHLSVDEYLKTQDTSQFEKAQDVYVELMQDIADIAFMFFLDTGLAQSGEKKTLLKWRELGNMPAEVLANNLGKEWIDYLMLPFICDDLENPAVFAQKHFNLLQENVHQKLGFSSTNQEFYESSVLVMGLALHLSRGLGANPKELADHWISVAKQNGGME